MTARILQLFAIVVLSFAQSLFAEAIANAESITFLVEVDQQELHRTAANASIRVDHKGLAQAIKRRLGLTGDATSLPNGQIRVDLRGPLDELTLKSLKMRATTKGSCEFRILANRMFENDAPIIETAQSLPAKSKAVVIEDRIVAKWVAVATRDHRENLDELVTRTVTPHEEALVLIDQRNVTRRHLRTVQESLDADGEPRLKCTSMNEDPKRLRSLFTTIAQASQARSAPGTNLGRPVAQRVCDKGTK